MRLIGRILKRRTRKTEVWRWDNEARHYRIRYEKARAMKRYNKGVLRAIGTATNPIKYQKKTYKVLRKYVSTNFRIDYNMRMRQLIYRSLRVKREFYLETSILIIAFTIFALLAKIIIEKEKRAGRRSMRCGSCKVRQSHSHPRF